ncbi:zinc-dependent metalloprotease [Streptomyces sp. NPDC002514]|uniref:zinc-dependent metalloprotease n=1 Tax=Streptomyces sp. NPDC001270 TaxID=3364554 RepID=UPI0036C6D7D1
MTEIVVLDDTRRHPELTERITELLSEVASPVAEVTGLALPPTVRFRLVTPRAWRDETIKSQRRTLTRDIADLPLKPDDISPAQTALKFMRVIPVLVWPLVVGATMAAADGQEETLAAPWALHHSGLLADEPSLVQMLAHELTHHLQAAAIADNTGWRTWFPTQRNLPHSRIVSTVVEGHARWTDQQVTTRRYGAPVDHNRAPKSLRHRIHSRIPGIRHLGPSPAAYSAGARFFESVAASAGVDHINRVWKDPSLLPTQDEFASPLSWLDRTGI